MHLTKLVPREKALLDQLKVTAQMARLLAQDLRQKPATKKPHPDHFNLASDWEALAADLEDWCKPNRPYL